MSAWIRQVAIWLAWKRHKWRTGHGTFWRVRNMAGTTVAVMCNDCGKVLRP